MRLLLLTVCVGLLFLPAMGSESSAPPADDGPEWVEPIEHEDEGPCLWGALCWPNETDTMHSTDNATEASHSQAMASACGMQPAGVATAQSIVARVETRATARQAGRSDVFAVRVTAPEIFCSWMPTVRLRADARGGICRATARALMSGTAARLGIRISNSGSTEAECGERLVPSTVSKTLSSVHTGTADITEESCTYRARATLSAMADGRSRRHPCCGAEVFEADPGLYLEGHCKICFAVGSATYRK